MPTTYAIESRSVEEAFTAILYGTVTRDELSSWLPKAFEATEAYLKRWGAGPAGPPYARFTDQGDGRFEVEAGFPATTPVGGEGEVEPSDLPEGTVAVTVHEGPYDTIGDAHEAILAWIAEQGGTPAGAPWEVYLTGPEADPPRTEVYQPYS
jgi:effector-binding domain-containing protein